MFIIPTLLPFSAVRGEPAGSTRDDSSGQVLRDVPHYQQMGENNVSQKLKIFSALPSSHCHFPTHNTCIYLSLWADANNPVQNILTALAEQYWLQKYCDPNGSTWEKVTFQNYDTAKKHTNKQICLENSERLSELWLFCWGSIFFLTVFVFIVKYETYKFHHAFRAFGCNSVSH